MRARGILILEGPDGVGKTTLADHLVKKFNAVSYHQTYRWANNMFAHHSGVLDRAIKLSRTRLVVLDRLWISEAIYAASYRGGTRWPQMGRMLDRVALTHCAINVICLPESIEAHSERFAQLKSEREEMYDNVDQVTARYLNLYHGKRIANPLDYVERLTDCGGMHVRPDVRSYHWQTDGVDLDAYCESLVADLAKARAAQYPTAFEDGAATVLGRFDLASQLIVTESTDQREKVYRGIDWAYYANNRHCIAYQENLIADVEYRQEHHTAYLVGGTQLMVDDIRKSYPKLTVITTRS